MKVNIEMSFEELKEFIEWKEDKKIYEKNAANQRSQMQDLAIKVRWAIEGNPESAGECVIVNQRHANELLDMAAEILE